MDDCVGVLSIAMHRLRAGRATVSSMKLAPVGFTNMESYIRNEQQEKNVPSEFSAN